MSYGEVAEQLAGQVLARIEALRPRIASTYRLQLHKDFTFDDAAALVPYLAELGITHIYASPYMQARPGSMHGYDACRLDELNPELGGEDGFRRLVEALRRHGLEHIADFVPNHMSASTYNPWWVDVLENGPNSPYSHYFDIDWRPVKEELRNKVLLPILAEPYGAILESGQLRLERAEGGFVLRYGDHALPVGPKTVIPLLTQDIALLRDALASETEHFDEYQSIVTALEQLPPQTARDPEKVVQRQREKEVIKRRLKRLKSECPAVEEFVARNTAAFNGHVGEPASFDALDALLSRQAYRLCHWRTAADEVNYRRFFDVNELAAICTELEDVFVAAHQLIVKLLAAGEVQGVRLDHLDGLFDPTNYLWRLQRAYVSALGHAEFLKLFPVAAPGDESAAPAENTPTWEVVEPAFLSAIGRHLGLPQIADQLPPVDDRIVDATKVEQNVEQNIEPAAGCHSPPLFVLVEKILAAHENLPPDWPVAGATGYEFGNDVNGLLLEPAGLREIHKTYNRFTGETERFDDVVHRSKLLILKVSMSSELQMLATRLNRISEQHRQSRDFTLNSLRLVLREIMACFPVYRTYPRPNGLSDRDRGMVNHTVAQARRRNPAFDGALFEFVRQVLLLEHPEGLSDAARREREVFTGRFQQVTSALMAKGVEDTAFYLHFPLASLNEVGGHPSNAALSIADFHMNNARRQAEHPRSLLATSTHDTKRSEDVRARIQVLSERPRAWRTALNRWAKSNRRFIREVDGLPAPSRNDEYLFYQTLVGIWPAGELSPPQRQSLVERLQQYMAKATHEAKARTSWINPNAAYDEAVANFVARVLEPRRDNRFLTELPRFVAEVAGLGFLNALSQTTLKLLSPGVPDTYQGQELWDFSLVDPDNRRPVDYNLRRKLLAELQAAEAAGPAAQFEFVRSLARNVSDPRNKLLVTWKSLAFRRDHCERREPGTQSEYIPLTVTGEFAEHVCAFAWKHTSQNLPPHWSIVAAPRWFGKLADAVAVTPFVPLGRDVWRDTTLQLPSDLPHRFTNLFTGQSLASTQTTMPLADILSEFPVALLTD